MQLQKRKTYYIPPKLNRSYLLAGFTVVEMLAFLVLLFTMGALALKGLPAALAVPAIFLVLHCRVLEDGRNTKQVLFMRWKYFKKEQSYSLQECERKK